MSDQWRQQYLGQGKTLAERGGELRQWVKPPGATDPSKYLAGEELQAAVNVALALGQPLLLAGDPGTGKTELASSLVIVSGSPFLASPSCSYDVGRVASSPLPLTLPSASASSFIRLITDSGIGSILN